MCAATLTLQVLGDWMLIGKAVTLKPSKVNCTEARPCKWAVKVRIKLFDKDLDEIPIAHHARDHQCCHKVIVKWRIWVHTRFKQFACIIDVAIYNSIFELPQVRG